ncbi:MAG TPA: ABC transporter ATP-binding protein [Vicinamibacterales bacterium]|nr:ABC transporter ATP-binding protein [Vicinamibacterales bacterium]
MLQAVDVTFGYDDAVVVRDVSLDVADDGFVGIIGPNGSGKTTLLRLLAGTRTPVQGRVTLDGVPLASLHRAAIARRMSVVPQETHLAFEYSALEVVLMGRYPHLGAFAVEGPADLAIAREALGSTGTRELEHRPFSTLSGGEKQRVIIAAALAQISGHGPGAPTFLLLDEPTAALDLKYQLGVASLLRSLHRAPGLSVIVSTHDLNFAASLCRTLVMLKHGRVIAAGPVDEVLTSSRIRELYEVDAEVARHPRTGHLTVTPIGDGDRA